LLLCLFYICLFRRFVLPTILIPRFYYHNLLPRLTITRRSIYIVTPTFLSDFNTPNDHDFFTVTDSIPLLPPQFITSDFITIGWPRFHWYSDFNQYGYCLNDHVFPLWCSVLVSCWLHACWVVTICLLRVDWCVVCGTFAIDLCTVFYWCGERMGDLSEFNRLANLSNLCIPSSVVCVDFIVAK
jgi:hypothetical protein